jgi:hypothetical protein
MMSLPFIAKISPALSGVLGLIAPFICPIMMGLMVFLMLGKKKSPCCNDSNVDQQK